MERRELSGNALLSLGGGLAGAAPKTGIFNVTMRNHMPSPEIVEQRYDPPVTKRVG